MSTPSERRQLAFWNSFKRLFCYTIPLRSLAERFVHPWRRYERIADIDPAYLKSLVEKHHVKLILLDMDGTLKHYKTGVSPEIKSWLAEVGKFTNLHIISNARRSFVTEVAEELSLPYSFKARKPHRRSFTKILRHYHLSPSEVILIGDGIRGDYLGAKFSRLPYLILLSDLNML